MSLGQAPEPAPGIVNPSAAIGDLIAYARDATERSIPTVSPWVRALTTPWSAAMLETLHPMRTSRYLLSEGFMPWMRGVRLLAAQVGADRHPAAPDNPFKVGEERAVERVAEVIEQGRRLRDAVWERVFDNIYGADAAHPALSGPRSETGRAAAKPADQLGCPGGRRQPCRHDGREVTMTTLRNLMLAGALLLATPGLAEDVHHPPEAQPAAPQAVVPQAAVPQVAAPAPQPSQAAPMPGGPQGPQGMMGPGMMGMMGRGGMGMMGGAAAGAMGMGQMMDPGRIAGRIAFLNAELKITDAQQPLWTAFTEALKANRAMMGDMQEMMMAAPGGAAPTLLQRIEGHERMLVARLEAVRRLKAALGPLYASFDEAQKRTADQLMMPGGMGPM